MNTRLLHVERGVRHCRELPHYMTQYDSLLCVYQSLYTTVEEQWLLPYRRSDVHVCRVHLLVGEGSTCPTVRVASMSASCQGDNIVR